MEHFFLHFHSRSSHFIPKKPFSCFPTIPTLQDPPQLQLGIFPFFILFNWIFQLHSLIFPLPWALLLGGNPCFPQAFPNSHLRLEFRLPTATSEANPS